MDDLGDIAVAGFATNSKDATKSAGFINLREGVTCLMAWQRTFPSYSFEFRAIKIEQQTPQTAFSWLKVHVAAYEQSSSLEIFMSFDAAGQVLYQKAIQSAQQVSQYLVSGIQILQSQKYLMVSDTRIQKLDAIGDYFYFVRVTPTVKRIRYASMQGTSLLVASTSADSVGIVTGLAVQSLSFIDTDLSRWEQGLAIQHGYGAVDVDVKLGVYPGAQSVTDAAIFMCSNAVSANVVADDPLTVKDESKTDSIGNTIINPGVYFDLFILRSGLILSLATKQWVSCHDVAPISDKAAYFLVQGTTRDKLYLIQLQLSFPILSAQSVSYSHPNLTQSVSAYGSNFAFLQTTKSKFAYGFTRKVANKSLSYDVFAVIDLGLNVNKYDTTPYTWFDSQKPPTSTIAGGAVTSKDYRNLVGVQYVLPNQQPQDYWTTADMWEPYLTTISKGQSNYQSLGAYTQRQDVTSLQSILRFQKNAWVNDVCPDGMMGSDLPQTTECWLADSDQFSTCSTQVIDLGVLNDARLTACFPRRLDHSTLNYDYTTGQQFEENLKSSVSTLQYPQMLTLDNSGRRSMLSTFLFSDTQQEGVTVSSYGDASFLTVISVPPGSGASYWIFEKISAKSALLSTYEVLKVYCARFDWSFNFITSQNLCSTFDSFQQRQFQSPTLLSYDTYKQYVLADKLMASRGENQGQYLVHIELATLSNRLSLVYSFDMWLAIGDNPTGQQFQPSQNTTQSQSAKPIYRTHANPYSPININYEWPVYYELNRINSSFIMTPPDKPVNLSTYNITLPGYLPSEFYVDPRIYIVDPPKAIPEWTQDNIGFIKPYPKQWSAKQLQQAFEDEYARYKRNITDSGTIFFSTDLRVVGDPDEGKVRLEMTFNKEVYFPSYLDPKQSEPSTNNGKRNLESRQRRNLAYSFPNLNLQDARTQLQQYMQTRPTQLVDPTFRNILQASSINSYLTRVDTFSTSPNPLPADVIYANKVASKVKKQLVNKTAETQQVTTTQTTSQAYDKEAEIALLAEMENKLAASGKLFCIRGYKYDAKQNLCLKDTNVYPTTFPKELPPPKLLPVYFGEITDMVSVNAKSQEGEKASYGLIWQLIDLTENSITLDLTISNPGKIRLGDYLEVSLDFSSFDKNWETYSTGLKQTEFFTVKTVPVSLRDLDPGTGRLFTTLREIARVLQMTILAYFSLCAALKLFANVSAFNGFVLLNSIQLLIHIPLLGLEFPKLTGDILKPLIVIAKCDLSQIVKKKVSQEFHPHPIAAEFQSISTEFDYHVAAYFDALYGSPVVVNSIDVILILYAIGIGAMVLTPVFLLFQRIKVAHWIYQRVLLRTFILNFPLRLTIQAWLFIVIGTILNFWLHLRVDLNGQGLLTPDWIKVSLACSILLAIVVACNQAVWLFLGCLPTDKLQIVLSKKRLYHHFGAVFDGIQIKRGALLYVGLSLLRRSLFVFTIFVLKSGFGVAVWFQVNLNTFVAMAYVIFIILTRPHEENFSLCMEIFGELTFITTVYAGFSLANGNGLFTDEEIFEFASGGFTSFKRTEVAGYVILCGLLLSIAIQTLATAGNIFRRGYQSLKQFVKRGKFRTDDVKIFEIEKTVRESFAQTELDIENNPSKTESNRNLLGSVAPSEDSDMSDLNNIITGLGKRNTAAFKTDLPVISESEEVSLYTQKKSQSGRSQFKEEDSNSFDRASENELPAPISKVRPQSAYVRTAQKNPQTDTYEIKSNKSASNRLTMDRPKRVEFSDQLESSVHPKSKQSFGANSSFKRKHLFYQHPDNRTEFSSSEEDSAQDYNPGQLLKVASKERPSSAKSSGKKIKTVVDAMVESSCHSDHFEQVMERRELSSKSLHQEAYFKSQSESQPSDEPDDEEIFETHKESMQGSSQQVRKSVFQISAPQALSSQQTGQRSESKSDSQKMTDKSVGLISVAHQTDPVTQEPPVDQSEESSSRSSEGSEDNGSGEECEDWTEEEKSDSPPPEKKSPEATAIEGFKAIKVQKGGAARPETQLVDSSASIMFDENSSDENGPKQGEKKWTDSSQSDEQVFDFWKRLDD